LTGISARPHEMVPRLRELPQFSLVFDTRTRWSSLWHSRRVLRRDRYYCCSPGYLLSDSRPGRLMRPRHIGARAMSLAQAALGKAADGSGKLACSAAARELAQRLLPAGRNYVGLAIGSREVRKNWPLERYIELARALVASGRTPAFLLGPQEAAISVELLRQIPESMVLDFQTINPEPAVGVFDAVIAVAERLSLVVANDSGLGHLAGAVGRPVVSLFGPTDPRRWGPMTPLPRIVRSQDFGGDDMSAIAVAAVLKAIDEVPVAAIGQAA